MKAIILAAGEGSRLKPLTDDKPKCMVDINGRPLLDIQIETIKSCGINDIVVVKGHMADKIIRDDIKHLLNADYNTTNMVMTLWCAESEMDSDIIISYGDILFNRENLISLINDKHDISVVVDTDWEKYWRVRFDDPLLDAEALSINQEGFIEIIGQKPYKISDIEAGYIGLIKLSKKGVQIFKSSFKAARATFSEGGKPWGTDKHLNKVYMTDMLQGLINEGNKVYAVKVAGGWVEIDSLKDYELAKKLMVDGEIRVVS